MYSQCLIFKMTQCYSFIHGYSNEEIRHVYIFQHLWCTVSTGIKPAVATVWIEDRHFCFRRSRHWWQSHDNRKHVTPTTHFSWNQATFIINILPKHLELTKLTCSTVSLNTFFLDLNSDTVVSTLSPCDPQGSCWSPWLWWDPLERWTSIIERGEAWNHGEGWPSGN